MKSFKLFLVPAILLAAASAAFAGSPYHGSSYGYSSHSSYNNYSYNSHSYNNYSYSHYTPSYSSDYCYTPSYSNYSSFDNYSYGQPTYYNNSSYTSLNYGSWTYDQGHNYYYCVCNYRPAANAEYSKYVCIYNPQYSNCCYYYNPIAKTYWGRYDYNSKGFSILGAGDQRSSIADLPQDKFGAAVAQASIPGSQVGENLTAPPALPTDGVAVLPAK